MPPASRNHRVPTAGETPASTAASSLGRPAAIATQNRRCSSCRRTRGGRASVVWLVLHVPNAATLSSSQPPPVRCCDDRLNSPALLDRSTTLASDFCAVRGQQLLELRACRERQISPHRALERGKRRCCIHCLL